jgi:16S rRNA (cytidine1402-2'-O)-methyltransferase
LATLHLLTLPIGNIGDITTRVKKTLEREKFFLAEDTRVFKTFLEAIDIDSTSKIIYSFHDHTDSKITGLIKKMDEGQDLFLVSDAGSPVISDPAYPLIKQTINAGHELETYPGPTSVVTALELSCLPPHPFHFYGFLAREKEKKRQIFNDLLSIPGTHIFFDSPKRMEKTLEELALILPDSEVAVVREITKSYQSTYRFLAKNFKEQEIEYRGEFVFLFHIAKNQVRNNIVSDDLINLANDYLNKKSTPKQLSKLLGKLLSEKPSVIYEKLTHK